MAPRLWSRSLTLAVAVATAAGCALPGGPTYVNTGLIRAAENEAQLAGVMAHEIAHVALRHGTNQASKANLLQLPAMLAGAAVGGGGLLGLWVVAYGAARSRGLLTMGGCTWWARARGAHATATSRG